MRRIFTVVMMIVSMMSFTGCRHHSETQIKSIEHLDNVVHVEYNGHKYIMMKYNGSTNMHNITGVVHDPDCKCNNR